MSSMTACASGTSAAPNTPCRSLKPTICSIDCAIPHSIEAKVKPAAQATNSRLRPKRSAGQPIGGVMIADATMKEVSTQLIWS